MGAQDLSFTPGLPSHWPQAELTLRRDGHTMRFLLLRATATHALTAAANWGAECGELQLLLPGQRLRWPAPARRACYVVPLG
jgi:cyclic beta-1,2-glucan synthetase